MMKEQKDIEDDDFIKFIKNGGKKTDKYCCTWKACCITTTVAWLLSTISVGITLGVLIGKDYINVTFQNPHDLMNITNT